MQWSVEEPASGRARRPPARLHASPGSPPAGSLSTRMHAGTPPSRIHSPASLTRHLQRAVGQRLEGNLHAGAQLAQLQAGDEQGRGAAAAAARFLDLLGVAGGSQRDGQESAVARGQQRVSTARLARKRPAGACIGGGRAGGWVGGAASSGALSARRIAAPLSGGTPRARQAAASPATATLRALPALLT